LEIGVVADDLTGAADSGVQFARAGHRAAVIFLGEKRAPSDGLAAVVVDTDSRSLGDRAARKRVAEAVGSVGEARILLKKIDSTLRGPVAAELDAALEASERRVAVVAPAFPEARRTTVGGTQLVDRTPVHETEFADDPRTPVTASHVPTLLRDGGLGEVRTLGAGDLADVSTVEDALRARWVVADATTDADLDALVRKVAVATGEVSSVLWAGSAGLAAALGRAYPGQGESREILAVGRVVVVVGSASGVAREQVRALVGGGRVTEVVLGRDALRVAASTLKGGSSVVLRPGERRVDPSEVVGGLAEVVVGLSRRDLFEALVLTGGETAVTVARGLGARGILLGGEVEPGVPLGTLIGARAYPVVTKAGGFGGPETLRAAWRLLAGEEGT
jgi:D-threonate/D-erythronate kinase